MPRPAGWMWGRVAGDVLDIGSVAVGMLSKDGNFPRGLLAMTSLLGVTAIDRVRAVFLLPKGPDLGLRELESERLDGGKDAGAFAARACSAIRICWAAMPADRPNTRVCRLPMSGPLKVPEDLTDEQVLFLSDIFPTGYMGAEMCNIKPGDTIAVWGCGPVGQFAIKSAFLLGAERVIAHRSLPVPAANGAGKGRRRDDQLRRDERSRSAQGDDRRPRAGRMHRRGRHGGARARAACTPTTARSRR